MSKSKIFEKINGLLQTRHFDDAITLIQSPGLEANERLECMGNFYYYKRDFQSAINTFDNLFKQFPNSRPAKYYYLIGLKMERENGYKEAFEYYRSAIEIEPMFAD